MIETETAASTTKKASLRRRLAGSASAVPWVQVLRWVGVVVFFGVAAVVQTWPLVRHLDDSLSVWWFFPYDAWAFLWNLWWVQHSLVALENPFHTDLLFTPQGQDLYLHPLTFVNGLLSLPFQLVTGNVILAWNLVVLLSFTLAGVGTYALVHRVTGNHVAGLVSGMIFAFAPITMMRLGGHWNMVGTWPIPFVLLFLVRFLDSRRLWDAAAAGFFWAVLTYNWLEYATDIGLTLIIFFGYWSALHLLKRQRQRLLELWRGGAVAAVVWIVLCAPFLIPAIQDARSGDYYQPGGDEGFSADLLAYVTPSPLWGPGLDPPGSGPNPLHQAFNGSIEGTAYLGILPLLLAGVAALSLRGRAHQVTPWLITFLAFGILALGPRLWVDESQDFTLLGVSFSVPLPYQVYDRLPLVGDRRVPARMIVVGMMALSVLAGIGVSLLMDSLRRYWRIGAPLLAVPLLVLAIVALERWEEPRSTVVPVILAVVAISVIWGVGSQFLLPRLRQPWSLLGPAVGLVALGIVGLEYWNAPIALTPHSQPAALREIGSETGDFAVLHAPLGRRNGWTCAGDCTGATLDNYYQMLHEKPSFGGYISRVRTEGFDWFLQQPGLRYLSCTTCPEPAPGDADLDSRKVRRFFREHKIKYVIVHRLDPRAQGISYVGEENIQKTDRYLRDVVGFEPVYDDPELILYADEDADGPLAGDANGGRANPSFVAPP